MSKETEKKTKLQMIWIRVSYSEYHEIEAESPEDALEKIDDGDLWRGEELGTDSQHEIEEVCKVSQL